MTPMRSILFVAVAGLAAGQYDGWEPGQVETAMCYWDSPRAALIRDTLWLDGGTLAWSPKMPDGRSDWVSSDNTEGLMYSFNFSKPFATSSNLTTLIDTRLKSDSTRAAQNFIDGALLHNDAQFIAYGGSLLQKTDTSSPPPGDEFFVWRSYSYGAEKPSFKSGSDRKSFGDNPTRYVAFGGAASAPSENKAWYVGGMRSPVWGEIFRSHNNRSMTANTTSNRLITLDMAEQYFEKFSNDSLPDNIKPRASPSVVWVPVGSRGILIVIGGVTYPEFSNYAIRKSTDAALNEEESPEFMKTIDVYDVASKKWFQQETRGGPPALTKGCAVLATAEDRSSFNIYYYGGYAGIDGKTGFSDDVWVLSLPSFQWIKVYQGVEFDARAGHQCVMPYPDQMMVIGGFPKISGNGQPACLSKSIFRMFNVSSAEWLDEYNPSKWSNYTVPTAVQSKIGGNGRGSATAKTPTVSGWADPTLASVFATPYDTTKIKTWYPYSELKETDRPEVDPTDGGGGGGGGTPKWVAPVLGVVLGLVFVTAILVGCCLWRRRKVLRRGNGTATVTEDNGSRIISWIRGQPSEPPKAPTVTTEETLSNPDMTEVRTPPPAPAASPVPFVAHEMADNHIAELPDTSPRAELHGVGLTPVEIINKHTHFGTGSNPATTHQSSYYASVSSNENASSLSRSSGVLGFQTRAQSPEPGPPSPPITTAAPVERADRVGSDVSGLSDHDARHLRHVSQATVSSASSGGEQETPSGAQIGGRGVPATVPETPTPGHPSPLSPPTGASDGDDYITARMLPVSPAGTATLRRSMFHESEDDLGATK